MRWWWRGRGRGGRQAQTWKAWKTKHHARKSTGFPHGDVKSLDRPRPASKWQAGSWPDRRWLRRTPLDLGASSEEPEEPEEPTVHAGVPCTVLSTYGTAQGDTSPDGRRLYRVLVSGGCCCWLLVPVSRPGQGIDVEQPIPRYIRVLSAQTQPCFVGSLRANSQWMDASS